MQTKSAFDVRTVIVVASLVALAALAVWSIGLWLASTQSLQNQMDQLIAERNSLQTQVTSLQNQIASLNMQLVEQQEEIENLDALVTVYRKDIADLLELLYPKQGGVSARARLR